MKDDINKLEKDLIKLDAERVELITRIRELRKQDADQIVVTQLGVRVADTSPSSSEEKIALFYKLFCCRKFEAVLKQMPARYITGLTATPYRKDRLEKILFQQLTEKNRY